VLQANQAIVNASLKLQSDLITVNSDKEKLNQAGLTAAQKQPIQDEILKTNAEVQSLQAQLGGANVGAAQKAMVKCQSILSAIEAFLANLTGGSVAFTAQAAPSAPSPAQPSSAPSTASPATNMSAASPTAPAASTPAIIAVLSADGLAQSIGATDDKLEPDEGWHLLWLKALESGGALITESNVLGSKVHFSGGAVASFDLFKFDGSLSCSGNVFAYGGYVEAKNFQEQFDAANIDPRQQQIFLRGGCAAE
jgi:hypothetical protein